MEFAFYLSAAVAVIATIGVVAHSNPVHALLYFIVSLLAISDVFFSLGAYFAGALEIIVYAGAIMVLFVFVVMMLNLGNVVVQQEKEWLKPKVWLGPSVMAFLLLIALVVGIQNMDQIEPGVSIVKSTGITGDAIISQTVGEALFGRYVLMVQLASMLLLAGLVAAYHLGREHLSDIERNDNHCNSTEQQIAGGRA